MYVDTNNFVYTILLIMASLGNKRTVPKPTRHSLYRFSTIIKIYCIVITLYWSHNSSNIVTHLLVSFYFILLFGHFFTISYQLIIHISSSLYYIPDLIYQYPNFPRFACAMKLRYWLGRIPAQVNACTNLENSSN